MHVGHRRGSILWPLGDEYRSSPWRHWVVVGVAGTAMVMGMMVVVLVVLVVLVLVPVVVLLALVVFFSREVRRTRPDIRRGPS